MGEQIDLRAFLVCFQRIIDDWLDRGGGEVGVRHGIGGKVVVRDEKMVVRGFPNPASCPLCVLFSRPAVGIRPHGIARAGPGVRRDRTGTAPGSFPPCNFSPFFSIIHLLCVNIRLRGPRNYCSLI